MGRCISGLGVYARAVIQMLSSMGVVVVVVDATDLREMRGKMIRLGTSLAFLPPVHFHLKKYKHCWRVGFGAGVGMEGVMAQWVKDWSGRMI